jgi:pilus assembly protein CpaF
MLDRIETMALLSEHATSEGVRRQIASGIQLVIHLRKNSDGTRKIGEVLRVKGYDKGSMVCQYVISDDFKIEDQSYFEWVCQHDQINAHSG